MTQKWPKSMDYSPWIWSILGHFEISHFILEFCLEVPRQHHLSTKSMWLSMLLGQFYALLISLKIIHFPVQLSPKRLLITSRMFSWDFPAKFKRKMSTSKMVQNRSNPWTLVHAFGPILGHFDEFQNHLFSKPNISQMPCNNLQSGF